ncbi:rCG48397 [Rattus norvegicus]|uniref:RCG48397 n=1 Tax=Rattus norvegicus TaxID=10116 RepID=A6HX73_RAT|nr:rCG48397 [Rattus norvegicus]
MVGAEKGGSPQLGSVCPIQKEDVLWVLRSWLRLLHQPRSLRGQCHPLAVCPSKSAAPQRTYCYLSPGHLVPACSTLQLSLTLLHDILYPESSFSHLTGHRQRK